MKIQKKEKKKEKGKRKGNKWVLSSGRGKWIK